MDETASGRKLASIVAIDVAGYSRRTEKDEAAAIRAIAALRTKVAKAAAAHGGRVFNTAGDGFMLEFPTASGALAAAEEIAAAGDPPVRAGVHLGEVSVTDSGDLLGHGVNVAARIQQMASPGAVLASGDVKRAIRGPLGERLKPQGSVKLDKMSETLPVFALAPAEGGRAKGKRLDLRSPVIIAVAVLVLALAGLSLWLGRGTWLDAAPRNTRIAILPFDTVGQASGIHDFAEGLRDQILSVMSANQLQTVSRADSEALRGADGSQKVEQLGITLLLDGEVQDDAKTLSVRVHLDDPRQHVALWTTSLDGPASAAHDLQLQIATEVTNVLLCANGLQRSPSAPRDTDTIALFFHACDLSVNMAGNLERREQVLDALRLVVARAPRFARGHSMLASVLADRYRFMPSDQGAARLSEGSAEARRALAIDPNDGDAYQALTLMTPVSMFKERERLLQRGLAGAPTNAGLAARYAEFLAEVGRMDEAIAYAERAAAHSPLDPGMVARTPYFQAAAGQFTSADAGIADVQRIWPNAALVRPFGLDIAVWGGRWDQARALLGQPGPFLASADIRLWSACVRGLASRSAADVELARRDALVIGGSNQTSQRFAIQCLAQLGLVDDAFAESERYQPNFYVHEGSAIFFFPSTAAMRRDRRFMKLAARIGLVDYWRTTGIWPDFCAEPGLPYDCKAEAAKYAGGAHG